MWLLGPVSLFVSAPAYSQSLGDIARKERERKQSEPAHETHVYDNSDLQKTEILVPEDQERAQAAKQKAAPAGGEPPDESAGNETGAGMANEEPLGDIARRYRAMKAQLQKAETAQVENQGPAQRETGAAVDEASAIAVAAELKPTPRVARAPRRTASPQKPRVVSNSSVSRMTTSSPVSARQATVPSAIPPAAEKSVAHEKMETGRRVRVKAGDTLWSIAAKFLGRGDKWQALAKGNPQLVNPAQIQVGAWVALPDETGDLASRQDDVATAPAPFVEGASASVKVERGDSLWKVAEVKLGNGEAWKCVARANRGIQNSDRIFPGQILTVPASCGGDGSQIADLSQALSSAFSKRAALAVQAMRYDQR